MHPNDVELVTVDGAVWWRRRDDDESDWLPCPHDKVRAAQHELARHGEFVLYYWKQGKRVCDVIS